VFAFFAVARFKLPHYALPAYPAVALLAVRWWQGRRGAARGLTAALAVAFALLAAALGLSAAGDGRALSGAVFSATDVYTRKEGAAGQGSPLPAWPALAPLAGGAALALGAGSAGLAVALARRSRVLGLGSALAAMLAVMPAATAALGAVASARAVAGLAADLRALLRPGDVLVHEGPIENSGALEFYSGRRPALLDARRSVLGIGATFPEAGETFWGAARLGREWASERRVFLVTPRGPARSLVAGLPPGRVHLLEQRDGRWLYSNAGPQAPAGRALAGPSAPALR
jgi:hypothetical protein